MIREINTLVEMLKKQLFPEWDVAYLSREYALGDDIEYTISELVTNNGSMG